MKKSLCAWSLAGMFALAGCATGTAGGPGAATSPDSQPIIGQANDTFQLSTGEATLRQGETKSVAITIKRSLNFDEEVTVQLPELPKGLSVDNTTPRIRRGDTEARFLLTATSDASLGDFSLRVTGHPTHGIDATNKLEITVTQK